VSSEGQLPVRTKLAFGVGASAEAAVGIGFMAFNLLFYYNVLGLPAKWCGTAVMIALLFDAVSDPLMGAISDRWRSRWGRRHPFLFVSAIPLGASFVAIYSPPEGMGHMGLFLWLTGWTIAMRQSLTLYQVPHLALGAELSTDYIERSRVMSHNALFGVFGGAGIYLLAWQWFGSQPGSTENAANYLPMAIGGGVFAALVILSSAWFTRDRIPLMAQPGDLPPFSVAQFWREIRDCLRNPNYRVLLLGLVFLGAALGIREAVNALVGRFFWEFSAEDISYFGLATPPAYMLAFAIIPFLHRSIDKRWSLVLGIFVVCTAAVTPVSLRLWGSFPENGDPWVWRIVMFGVFAFYTGIAVLSITVMSALADVADEHEVENGRRQEGILYAARTFFGKVTQGLGYGISGFIVDAIGFESGSTPGSVAPEVLYRLGVLDGPIAVIPAVIALFFYGSYRIDKKKHAAIRARLEARRAASPPAT
jgi:Na+/melibiose symporter-like transporter